MILLNTWILLNFCSENQEIHSDAEVEQPVQNAGKKGKKDRKKKKEAELEEAQAELEALADGGDLADVEPPKEQDIKPKKSKKKKKERAKKKT